MSEIAGLSLIVPTSVAGSGVSVSASGKVSFSAATAVNINGCFSATYDNYLLVACYLATSAVNNFFYRLRASGSDATGSDYTRQTLWGNNTSVTGGRSTGTYGGAGLMSTGARDGAHLYLYGPFLAQPTASISLNAGGPSPANLYDEATTHSLSTSYDGISIIPGAGNITGSLTIYGFSQ